MGEKVIETIRCLHEDMGVVNACLAGDLSKSNCPHLHIDGKSACQIGSFHDISYLFNAF
jgi:hypothetical protein